MPPRRSTRASTRSSVEPTPLPAPKRKRGQSSEPKPATKRRSSARLSAEPEDVKPRTARSRRKPSLEEVPESEEEQQVEEEKVQEEEEEEELPKPKRSRPSLEQEEDKEDDTVEESPKPKRGKRGSSKPVSRSRRSTSAAAEERRVSGRTAGSSSASHALPKVEEEETQEKEALMDTDKEDALPPPSQAPAPKPVAEEEEEQSLLDPKPLTLSARRALGSQKSFLQPHAPSEPKKPKARLVISKLALVNFKSYAGRQEIGPFHKSFSAIVGPNGSGKSNTIDALLFVFGYRATKMRQAKLSELIHHSALYPDLDFCSVEVHFQDIIDKDGDEYDVVPGTKLVVTRFAYKNNTSRYTINGNGSNYNEVQALLKGRGIDLDHNRFLILQGEVESIAQMKPKAASEGESDGLLEYLEDIIGTSSLLPDITASQEALEALTEERQVKLNRVRHVEKEKAKLEKDKREAEDYLRLKNKHTEVLNQLYQLQIYTARQHDKTLKQKEEEHAAKLEKLREENEADLEHLTSLEKHFEERQAAYKQIAEALETARRDLSKQEARAGGIEERKKHEAAKNKKLKKTLQEDQKALDAASRSHKENEEILSSATEELDELEERLKVEEKELAKVRDSLKDKTQVYHDQIEAVQKQLQPCQERINVKQAELDIAVEEKQDREKKVSEARTRITEAEEQLEELTSKQAEKESALEHLISAKSNLKKEIEQAENNLKRINQRVEELRAKASASRQRISEAKANQAQQTSQNRVVQTLNQYQRQGRINGFHGRLGNLGTIPDQYDVAITTACSALNNMVVDTVEQAQACIEVLRANNAGRASFMVLEKLPKQGPPPIQTPQGSRRLFDLITPADSKFAPVFFKAIGHTLVTEDMDMANKIAYGPPNPVTRTRWRVVTTAGQLIDSSGTMSGGGNSVSRGGMSAKLAKDAVAPEVMREWERDDEKARQALDDAMTELRDAEAAVDRLQRSAPQLDMDTQKAKMELETGKKRIADAERRLKELSSQKKLEKSELNAIQQLDGVISQLSDDMRGLKHDAEKFEKKIKDLEQQIIDVGGAKLLMQKGKVDATKLSINLGTTKITKAEVAMAKAEKDVAKLEKDVEANQKKLISSDDALAKVVAELEEIMDYIKELRTRVEQAQDAAETSKEDLEQLKAELDEKNGEIQSFRNKEAEIKRKVEDIAKERKKFDQEIQAVQSQLQELELIDIDDEDEEDAEEPEASKRESTHDTTATDMGIKAEPDENPDKENGPKTLKEYSEDELRGFRLRELMATSTLLNEKIQRAHPDLTVLEEYARREEEFLTRAADLEKTTAERDAEKAKYDALRKRRLDEFMAGFTTISLKLKEMYQMITLGGNAELELVDSMDPFSEGIIFSVMPPKKSWKNISNLSGGEKTLSSLALVFALHVYKPTPLYFMDEIDAALDFRNVSIVANYIKDRTKDAQFIIISLRNDMFELSHRLIGIYKTANTTKSISVANSALATEKLSSRIVRAPA